MAKEFYEIKCVTCNDKSSSDWLENVILNRVQNFNLQGEGNQNCSLRSLRKTHCYRARGTEKSLIYRKRAGILLVSQRKKRYPLYRGPLSYSIYKNKLKMDKRLQSIKLLEENIGCNLFDTDLRSIFGEPSP